jgi:hypothetical protein
VLKYDIAGGYIGKDSHETVFAEPKTAWNML